MFPRVLAIAFAHWILVCSVQARDIHVDPQSGSDSNDGVAKPVKTIARGLKLAQAGDTVHLATAVYRETAVFYKRDGEPGKPITLDGHGAVLEGSEPLNVADWQETAPGLFRNDKLLRLDDAVLQRWFFLFDGKMNHMGRSSKGVRAPLKKPEDLQPGEWTFIKDESRTVIESAQLFGAFYIKLEPDRKLADAHIAAPLRSAGVQFSGVNSHIVVRNIIATHVYNDGCNIHGTTRDCRFENIASIECGDDGFSAHEDAECEIDGFVSIGNSTGMCDTVESRTHYKNVFISGCLGYDVFFVSHGDHSIENAIVESSAASAVSIGRDAAKEGVCNVRFKNMHVRRVGGPQEFRINPGSHLEAERCTIENLKVQVLRDTDVSFKQCLVTGDPKPDMLLWKDTKWRSEGNAYDLKSLRVDKTSFTETTFVDFQKLFGSEARSKWEAAPKAEMAGVGADDVALKKLSEAAADTLRRWNAMK